ncbi:MAG: RHS repeat protein, partial [Acidobacteriaceae bacterium]|nr:RHS repeat protein [Acidobacteriaceae bacterium]
MLVSLPITAWSQDGVSFPDTAPQRGVSPIGSYTFDKLEAISKSTVLTYTIPLTTMPLGRGGMSIPINLVYNSAQFDYSYSYTYETSPPYSPILNQTLQTDPFGGWQVTAGYGIYTESRPLTSSENCNTGTGTQRSSLVMPDGSRHILQFYGFPQSFTGDGTGYYPWDYRGLSGCTNYTSLNGNVQTFTSDGSYIRVDASLNSGTWAAHLPDGTTVTNCTVSCSGGVPEQVIADRNANKITIQYFQTSSPYTLLTDDVGRTVKISAPPGDYSQITQTGYSGESLTWTFGPAPNSNGAAFTFQYICVPSTGTTCTEYSGGGGTDQLQVPSNDANNPLVYTFQYFPLSGLLQKVTLPTGATTTYSYQCSNYQKCFNGFLQNAVTSKQVVWYDQADGGNTQRVEDWSYSWSSSPAGHVLFTRVGPDGGKETSCMGAGPTGSFGVGSLATKIVQPNGDSVDYFYEGNRPYGIAYPQGASTVFNPWLAAEVHNIAASNGSGAESSISLYTADKNGNQLTAKTYDWAAYSSLSRDGDGVLTSLPTAPGSALLHSTQNSYTIGTSAQAGTGAESVADDANAYWNPASKKFLHLLSRSVLTGSGANSAATEFSYDINANPTQERHWDSTKAATLPASLTGSNAAVTSYVFDGYGNVTQATDPAGNVTKYTYDGNNLYVSQKVQAFSTNIARTFNYGWDFDSGLLTSKTDANNTITTSYSYDALGRPTNVTEDATHLARQTNTTYDDANRRVIVQHDQSKSTDGLLVSVTNYDQLGKVALIQELENASSQSATDLTAGIKVQTRYMYSSSNSYKLVSNPYREPNSGAASTACNNNFANCAMGWTLTTFDQSNRVVSTQALDGSGLPGPWGSNSNSFGTVSTSYDAQYTTVTDQAGNARKSAVDGVGRLVSVVEDPGHLNYSTTYSYDTLDNVTGVNQSGMTRSFVYDSLKRLSSVANPESGATYYAYDNDGNLVKKTDARNIATSYTYDALNRITSKAYSDGTPAVAYTYDGGSAVPLSAGRLIQTSNGISTTNVLGYDGLGEITASQQITEGQIYNFAYTYNLAGQLTSEMYPSGRVMNNSYDGAGRISEVFGGLGTTQTSYVSSPSYFPDGDPGSFVYGNSLARLFGYNSRLQVSYIWD